MSILYIILALLGISFLIFIHELGHYFMARRCGITVEVFSIGFGQAIYKWKRDGVIWQVCWLPFGGYVKMAGMESKGSIDASQIPDGFFGAAPWKQIKVAFMGPLVNLVFALLAFSLLWALGGREKDFSEYTHYIGYIEKESGLYETGVRPGDEITSINGEPFAGITDLLHSAMLDNRPPHITGEEVDYASGQRHPFSYTFGEEKQSGEKRVTLTTGTFRPAEMLIYKSVPGKKINPMRRESPLFGSGISTGDRIMWVNGELIFSSMQLSQNLNMPRALLTIKRGEKTFLTNVPRLEVGDIQFQHNEKAEIDDWKIEAGLQGPTNSIFTIPYNLTDSLVIEHSSPFVNEKSVLKKNFVPTTRTASEAALQPGDKILAVWGIPVSTSYALLKELQTPRALIIIREEKEPQIPDWKVADERFANSFDRQGLKEITGSIGTYSPVKASGNLRLLNPVTPVPANELVQTTKNKEAWEEALADKEKEIQKIKDPKMRERAQEQFERYKNRLILGALFQDQLVRYNPGPITLFGDFFSQMSRTFSALFTGYLSPKHMAGPVGIVQQIQYSWTVGAKEALYWLGLISLNLGILNLLPIPMLDGGHIILATVQAVTKKPITQKVRERLILPFFILIIGFFIFLTYHDIVRIITRLF